MPHNKLKVSPPLTSYYVHNIYMLACRASQAGVKKLTEEKLDFKNILQKSKISSVSKNFRKNFREQPLRSSGGALKKPWLR